MSTKTTRTARRRPTLAPGWLLPGVLVATAFAEDLGPGEFEVQPRELAWEQLVSERVDLAWCLPDERRLAGKGFMAEVGRMLEVRFEPVALPTIRTASGEVRVGVTARSFGDLASAALSVPRAKRAGWLAALPKIDALGEWPDALEQLTNTRGLWDDWDPDDDIDDDGVWTTSAWDLEDAGKPWSRYDPAIQQAAALIQTDLATVKPRVTSVSPGQTGLRNWPSKRLSLLASPPHASATMARATCP